MDEPRRTVLVVDDEESVLRSTQLLLRQLGYEAVTTQDPSRVPELAKKHRPVAILQDLRIQGMSLAGLVATLRGDPETAEIPLVFFSASDDLARIASRHEAWAYLAKPYQREDLAQLLQRAEGRTQRGADPQALAGLVHDSINLIGAAGSYAQALRHAHEAGEGTLDALAGLEETLAKLRTKFERLRGLALDTGYAGR